jgi:hypothetical protein
MDMADEQNYIWVVPSPKVGNRVALAEMDPRHPLNEYGQHEVFVAHGTGPVQVAITPEVNKRLHPTDGDLVRVDGPLLEQAREQHKLRLDQQKAERERNLALQKQEEYDRIGEVTQRSHELQARLTDMERRYERLLHANGVRQQANMVEDEHRKAADRAEALARQADEADGDEDGRSDTHGPRGGARVPEGNENAEQANSPIGAAPMVTDDPERTDDPDKGRTVRTERPRR